MTDRDWDKELAKIDKQLASISDEALAAPAPAPPTGMPRGVTAAPMRSAPVASAPAASAPAVSTKGRWWTYTKVALASSGAVGIWLWPWAARCGVPLAGLVGAAGLVSLLGLWSARGTWRHRLGFAHVLSLLAVTSALVLGAREVLPRVGYAQPTFDRPDRWSCQAEPPAATTPQNVPASPAPGTTPPPSSSSL
jgi:hypothetical protein